jgi:hypothetical protein
MSRYFNIMTGLRGCYMPDSHYVARVDSRRELRSEIASECARMRDACKFGGSQRDISAAVAQVWTGYRTQHLDSVVPFGNAPGARPFAVFISPATRAEWKAQQEENA